MPQSIEAEILGSEENLRVAMLSSDISSLDKLLSSNLIFTNHLGHRINKEADLAAHESGTLKISELESSELEVLQLSQSVAVVSAKVKLNGFYAGQPAGGNFRFTRVWQYSGNIWQVVVAHSCVIA